MDCAVAPVLHKYIKPDPLLAVNITFPPMVNVVGPFGVIVAVGKELTVTVTLAVFVQPFASVTVTVYVVVTVGLATGLEIVVLLNPVTGVHT